VKWVQGGSGFALLSACLLSVAHGQDARNWLDRMNEALEELNYRGTFVHVLPRKAETLIIIHRNEDGQIGERIYSRDGVGREIVRRQDEVQCILPDRKVVFLEKTRASSPLVSALPSYTEQLEANYKFKLFSTDRVADRPTQVVGITPKDEYRYGYLVWLDQETAMPLRSQLWGEGKQVIEEILFTRIEFPESISLSELDPTIDTGGFTLVRPPDGQREIASGIPWKIAELPQGFRHSDTMKMPIAGSQYPVEHFVFTDGLATVSVFVEDPKTEADVAEGFSRFGSTSTFSLTLGGRKITAIGEVPQRTVKRIATSLQPQ
jgi:sigma-E factor negative regulatory protein RseB